MTNLISALALSFAMATAPEKPIENDVDSIVHVETLSFARCEIRDAANGFYGKGNCEKLMKAYAEYLSLKNK